LAITERKGKGVRLAYMHMSIPSQSRNFTGGMREIVAIMRYLRKNKNEVP
jgi:hypothetical protein